MTPYVEPTERPISITLADDEDSILYPEISRRSDYAETPNVVRLSYENASESLIASASNVDLSSRSSLAVRKYEITHSEVISELTGESVAERLENLKALALQKLIDKSSNIEYVDGKCQYHEGLEPNNAIWVDYVRAGFDWTGALTNVSVKLELGMPASFSARRFIRTGFKTEVSGEILWQTEVTNE